MTADEVVEAGRMMMLYPAIGVVLYLIIFHIGLYFDSAWDYEDEAWSWRGLLHNKRYRLAIIMGGLLVIRIIFKLIE